MYVPIVLFIVMAVLSVAGTATLVLFGWLVMESYREEDEWNMPASRRRQAAPGAGRHSA